MRENAFPETRDEEFGIVYSPGLTKLEYFVTHAPPMPDWFKMYKIAPADPVDRLDPDFNEKYDKRMADVKEVYRKNFFEWPVYWAKEQIKRLEQEQS